LYCCLYAAVFEVVDGRKQVVHTCSALE
jgi:hypothetical protein